MMEDAAGRNDRREPITVIPVHEERATVHTEVIETAKVTISKKVTEHTEQVTLPITNEFVQVERVPVNQLFHSPPPAMRVEGDTTIISVIKEVSVVIKKYEVVEELHIKKIVERTPLQQEIILRQEHVTVTRKRIDGQADHS